MRELSEIHRLPFELDLVHVRHALLPYGNVVSLAREFNDYYTGILVCKMEIEKPIPSKLIIKGQSAVITYKRQERTCFTCGSSSHENHTCPIRISQHNLNNNRPQQSTSALTSQSTAFNPTSRTDTVTRKNAPSSIPVITTRSIGTMDTTNTISILVINDPTDATETTSIPNTINTTASSTNDMDTSLAPVSTQNPATINPTDIPRPMNTTHSTPTESTHTIAVNNTIDTTIGPKHTTVATASTILCHSALNTHQTIPQNLKTSPSASPLNLKMSLSPSPPLPLNLSPLIKAVSL